MRLTPEEQATAAGQDGEAAAMAMRIVAETGRIMGAASLVEITSAHIDGCLWHGDSGVEFAEKLVAGGGRVRVPTTLNVGALDLMHPDRVRLEPERREMARRLMHAHVDLGCAPTFTCAPYQAGHRPGRGEQVAWGESNAVAFVNSVLGARSNRYGDLLDLCCALVARAPLCGLHLEENRRATILVDTAGLSPALRDSDVFWPVLGSWLGAEAGEAVAVIAGLEGCASEDRLKALGAAAASTGAVGLFHVAGVTPEAPDIETALGGEAPARTLRLTADMIRPVRDRMSTTASDRIDAVALGSPHFSPAEFAALESLLDGGRMAVPFYICTGRGVIETLEREGRLAAFGDAGMTLVADTCIVVTPVLPDGGGVLMTSSGKFAHYTPANTGWEVIYGSLADCVASGLSGRVTRDESLWR